MISTKEDIRNIENNDKFSKSMPPPQAKSCLNIGNLIWSAILHKYLLTFWSATRIDKYGGVVLIYPCTTWRYCTLYSSVHWTIHVLQGNRNDDQVINAFLTFLPFFPFKLNTLFSPFDNENKKKMRLA